MFSSFVRKTALILSGLAVLGFSTCLRAEQTRSEALATSSAAASAAAIPDAPQPQIEVAQAQPGQTQGEQQPAATSAPAAAPGQAQNSSQPPSSADPPAASGAGGLKNGVTQNCPPSQNSSQQPCAQKSQHEEGDQEVKEQEKQRVEGVIPTFNVTYRHNAVSLTPGQKMNLSLHECLDPFAFASAFFEAGYHEAGDDLKGFPWGFKGYMERSGVAYLDTFDGQVLSTGILPIVFRQDPRYFRLGYGPIKHRILYSLYSNVRARNDYNGKWAPNYGNILGNLAAGELSNVYYPAGNSSAGLALTNTGIQILEGAGGSIFNEFWPDLARRYLHKDPTHGLDAQAQAEYAAEKQQMQNEKTEQKQDQNQDRKQNQAPHSDQSPNPAPNPNQN